MRESEATSVANATAFKHVLLLVAGYVVGWVNDAGLLGVLVASLLSLGWHLYNVVRLRQWLVRKPQAPIPYGSGIWPTIYARISHFRERSSAHKQRSRELEHAQSAFVHTLPNAAFELNDQFEVLNANEQAIKLIDRDREQLTGHISNHLRQPDFVRYLQKGDYEGGAVIQAAHNPEVTLQCVISDHGVDGWLLQLIDISVQINALKIREDFVANASHELRTPVTVIKGYLEGLIDDASVNPEVRDPLTAMSEQVRRMEAIISDLLTLNVIESAGPAPTDVAVNVPDILKSITRDARASKHCPEHFELELDSDASILGDEVEIRSVMTNLVSNALRFTPTDGSITISWTDQEAGAKFEVRDTGIGIDEDDIPRITERFYRTVQGRNRHQFGTGLGLAIVKHALARHSSELRVESQLGEGSSFSCVFPKDRLT